MFHDDLTRNRLRIGKLTTATCASKTKTLVNNSDRHGKRRLITSSSQWARHSHTTSERSNRHGRPHGYLDKGHRNPRIHARRKVGDLDALSKIPAPTPLFHSSHVTRDSPNWARPRPHIPRSVHKARIRSGIRPVLRYNRTRNFSVLEHACIS